MTIMDIISHLILIFMYENRKLSPSFHEKLNQMSQRKQSIIKNLLPVIC